jgi:AraC-like DNA-binding protein
MSQIINFPSKCKEWCLPVSTSGCAPLLEQNVFVAGISHLVRGYSIKRLNPEFFIVIFTLAGEGIFSAGKRTVSATKGSVIIAPAGIPHHYQVVGDSWNKFWFHLYPDSCWDFLEERELVKFSSIYGKQIHNCMKQIITESVSDKVGHNMLMRAYSDIILTYLTRELGSPVNTKYAHLYSRFNHLWEQVSDNPSYEWSLKIMAKNIFLSVPHFCRLCRQFFNITPMRMVTRLRLHKAQGLLKNTDLNLEQIAEEVGYENAFSFSVSFKKLFGISPSSVRKM